MKNNFLIFFIIQPFPNNYQKISFLPLYIHLHQANHNHITLSFASFQIFDIWESEMSPACFVYITNFNENEKDFNENV